MQPNLTHQKIGNFGTKISKICTFNDEKSTNLLIFGDLSKTQNKQEKKTIEILKVSFEIQNSKFEWSFFDQENMIEKNQKFSKFPLIKRFIPFKSVKNEVLYFWIFQKKKTNSHTKKPKQHSLLALGIENQSFFGIKKAKILQTNEIIPQFQQQKTIHEIFNFCDEIGEMYFLFSTQDSSFVSKYSSKTNCLEDLRVNESFVKIFGNSNKTLAFTTMKNGNYSIQVTPKKVNFVGKEFGFSITAEKLGIENIHFAAISEEKKIVCRFFFLFWWILR